MIDLDDAAAVRAADPSGMLDAAAALPDDLRASYAAGLAAEGLPDLGGVSSVVFCGMGGSAVAGDVLRQAFRERLGVPVEVNRSHRLPAFAGHSTLVVVSSYSGETSETLSAYGEAVERGCRIVAVTSGGELGASCAERGQAVVAVPGGGQPRAALGHLTFATLGALEAGGLLPRLADDVAETADALAASIAELGPDVPVASNLAKQTAAWIGERVPVVWGAEGVAAVAAMRWKTQLNENGKVPAWHSAMSELDHNEVVGWVEPYGERYVLIALRHDDEHAEIAARFALSEEIARDAGAEVRQIHATGTSRLAALFTLVTVGDFTSCYVGLRRGVDPTPVEVIQRLKAALAEQGA